MASKALRLKLEIESEFLHIAPLALAVRGLCQITSMSPVEINRTELCLVEVVNNIIEHAYENQAGNTVCIEFMILTDYLTIKVYDSGNSLPQEQLVKKNQLSDKNNTTRLLTNGRGLDIVKSLMDSISYDSNKGINCFTMTKQLRY